LPVAVRVGCAGSIEAGGLPVCLDRLHLICLDEQELRFGIDEAPHEPCRCDAVDAGTTSGDPFHGSSLQCGNPRIASPATPAARMITGSGTFRSLTRARSVAPKITTVGASTTAR